MEAAKLEDFRFHDLRHTFASWAVQRGATLPELQDLLGHASFAMVRRYIHLAPENLRTAVARLEDVLATAPSSEPAALERTASTRDAAPVPAAEVVHSSR